MVRAIHDLELTFIKPLYLSWVDKGDNDIENILAVKEKTSRIK